MGKKWRTGCFLAVVLQNSMNQGTERLKLSEERFHIQKEIRKRTYGRHVALRRLEESRLVVEEKSVQFQIEKRYKSSETKGRLGEMKEVN